jgi:hypothetical protein
VVVIARFDTPSSSSSRVKAVPSSSVIMPDPKISESVSTPAATARFSVNMLFRKLLQVDDQNLQTNAE